MDANALRAMKLHEIQYIAGGLTVVKVLGGWLYAFTPWTNTSYAPQLDSSGSWIQAPSGGSYQAHGMCFVPDHGD